MAAAGKGKRRLMGEINVVPYIDVMLVLLIIFMVTAPLLTQGIKVDLPKAGAEPLNPNEVKNEEPLVLSIDARGRLYLNVGASPAAPLDDETALVRATAALRRAPQRIVLVKGDKAANYGRVVEAMVLLQKAGASKLGFVTDPLPPPPVPGS
jgi:biopolymer transport protein TolR